MIDYHSYPWDTGKQLCYQPNIFLNNQQFFYDTQETFRASSGKLIVSVYEMNT
ncbi:peptidoglycan-binding protein, partial [Bacillus cereus]